MPSSAAQESAEHRPVAQRSAEPSASFRTINRAYGSVFRPNRLSLGLVVPIESYPDGPVPSLDQHLERAQLAEKLGFAAVWLRDVPFNVPSFGDAGQTFDPFVYLGYLAARTDDIALGVASIILPLRHPAHVAKAAASVDVLSGGRVLLGVASGDRPQEYPALNVPFEDRGELFRASLDYMQDRWKPGRPLDNRSNHPFGRPSEDMELLPRPTAGTLPLLITGSSRQDPDWIARYGHGWMTYPRGLPVQARVLDDWRVRVEAAGGPAKPVMQPLYVDLVANPDAPPRGIHLGFRSGVRALRAYLHALEEIGVNHVAINLRFNRANIETTMKRLANELLPDFSA